MRYVSTRGSAPALDFEGATLAGLASDGGLYVPESWPEFSKQEIAAMRGLSYVDTAVAVMRPFVAGCLDDATLKRLTIALQPVVFALQHSHLLAVFFLGQQTAIAVHSGPDKVR